MICIQQAPFDAHDILTQLDQGNGATGALVQFIGVVRDDDDLTALELEHYPAMTEKSLTDLAQQAKERWDIIDLAIVHRVGRLNVGDQIMMVAVSAPHRRAAFEACDFLMDFLKSRAPFWKREIRTSCTKWVAQTAADEAALKRW